MSVEQPGPPHRDLSVIPIFWADTVTRNQITRLNAGIQQGNSLGAAIAGEIRGEQAAWINALSSVFGELEREREFHQVMTRINLYGEPANAFLSAEEYVRVGKLTSAFLDDVMMG